MTINNQKHKAQVLLITIFILTIALVGMFFILNPIKIKLLSIQNFANTYKAYNNAISGLNLYTLCISSDETSMENSSACVNFMSIIETSTINNTSYCYESYLNSGTCTTATIRSTGTDTDLKFEINVYKMQIVSTRTIYRLSSGEYKNNIKNILEYIE
ncbi:MAG: hypothetical protein KatS3mg097_269 [Candidatus Parcubacteria bacterium]|nr:MAG: hypothetical protein KatS3mg097_269 [Candidatus Parcubacteria bacterium]